MSTSEGELRSNGLRCFGHLQRRDSRYWTKDPENGAARKSLGGSWKYEDMQRTGVTYARDRTRASRQSAKDFKLSVW